MSELLLKKYADLFYGLDVLKSLDKDASGAYLIGGEDADSLNVLARLVAAKIAGLPFERAFDDHADIAVYPRPPEQKSGKKTERTKPVMNVDEVKEIISSLYLTPFELERRFYIIESAETMSDVCQNKLLKSLEEPPPRVCFILCSTRSLLPTVESRCISLRLPPFDINTVSRALEREHGRAVGIELAARAGRGNLGMSERVLADKDFNATYSAAINILKAASGSKNFAHAAAIYDKFTRERAAATLGVMEYMLTDVARLLSGLSTVFEKSDVEFVSDGFTPYSAARCTDIVRAARRQNDGNCMVTALLDETVLKIMEEKALCRM